MIGPLGPDSQDPAVSYSTLASTTPSLIDNFTATNGANPLGGNQGRNITWSVTATKDGIDASSYFGVSAGGTNEISSCSLSNVATNGAPTGIYDIKLRCTDAGGAFQEITITAQLGVIPSEVYDLFWTYHLGSDNSGNTVTKRATAIKVDMASDPLGYNGWYIVANSWSNISSGVDVISMKQQNLCSESLYFYSNATIGDVINNWKACTTNDNPPYQNSSITIPSSEFLQVGFEVIP
jgi:hypothetical protein